MEQERTFPDWKQLYDQQKVEEMPWYHPELDPDVVRVLAEFSLVSGSVLDLGTGPGTQALALAARGFRVTATDISETALRQARDKAQAAGLSVDFVNDDILDTTLNGPFDLIIDRGCFHIFAAPLRAVYVESVAGLLEPGGLLFLKTFSHREPRTEGPYRFTPEQIREYFAAGFNILDSWDSRYQGTLDVLPLALCTVLRKR